MHLSIREELPDDAAAMRTMIEQAFAGHPHSDGTEAGIVERLHAERTPSLSLVAADKRGRIIGQVAFSPVSISDGTQGWYGLGPLSVSPDYQGQGIGSALARTGLARLREDGVAGCVVLGDPAYYSRFGFKHDPAMEFPGVPTQYFQCLALGDAMPSGTVSYAPAFG